MPAVSTPSPTEFDEFGDNEEVFDAEVTKLGKQMVLAYSITPFKATIPDAVEWLTGILHLGDLEPADANTAYYALFSRSDKAKHYLGYFASVHAQKLATPDWVIDKIYELLSDADEALATKLALLDSTAVPNDEDAITGLKDKLAIIDSMPVQKKKLIAEHSPENHR